MEKQLNNYKKNIDDLLTKGLKKESRSMAGFFIRNFRFTYLIILAILVLGAFSLFSLPREADPEVKIPIAVVTTIFPGATPTDTEELITNKIEEKIKNLDDLKRYTSSSGQGVSSVVIEFAAEADLKDSYQKLRDEVSKAKPSLPPEAEDPIVTEIRISDMPIVTYSIVCQEDGREDCQIRDFVDRIQTALEGIADVSKVEIVGEEEREFQILASQTKLASYNISLGQIISAIARTNYNLPAGNIDIDGFNYSVRVKGKFKEISNLEEMVVTTFNNTPIYLKDIALVRDGFKERKTESRIGLPGQLTKDTISFQVYKKTGGNIINIVEAADLTVKKLKEKNLPKFLTIIKTNDNSWFIKDTLNTLGRSGLQTMVLIILLLFLVLGLRGAIITGVSVPIAFLIAFIFLYTNDQTLNSIVLYSLVISLGLMVDNSIIIMEGINEYITYHNKTPLEAALLSVWNFKWAITAGTLTTVAAFAPMLLVSGILGEFFSYIPKTISATLISSLFVALVIIPTLSSRFIKTKANGLQVGGQDKKIIHKRHKRFAGYINKIKKVYVRLMWSLLPNKKRRRLFMATAWILFILAVAIPATGMMKIEMFPPIDFDTFWITIEMPVGTTLENTKAKAAEVEEIVADIPELKSYVTSLGSLFSFDMGGGSSGAHVATIAVNIVDRSERDRKSYVIANECRKKVEATQGAIVKLEEGSAGPPTGAPIEVRIYGPETQELTIISTQIVNFLEDIEGTLNINDSLEEATGEFTFVIDKQQANYYGLDIITIASTLRNAIYGAKASAVTIGGEDIDITVKYDKDKFISVRDLENILIFTPKGENIALRQIAELSLEPSLLAINHRDGEEIVTVSAQKEDKANLAVILEELEKKINALNLPSGYRIEVGGEIEDIEQSYRELFLSMIVAVILIAFILVLQFNSFRQPFIILTTLPLAIIGVIIGLNILRMPFSFPAFLGIISLGGIAVNDAIVLVDRINKNCQAGMERVEAIIEAGQARMQPIFLTSLTTIAGIFPLLWASELWRPFSITLIFGLTFSTALVLVVVPILYLGFTRKDRFCR
ncbi:MAG: efflux RND transporter permease subunit [Patescibacteria group bacterium]